MNNRGAVARGRAGELSGLCLELRAPTGVASGQRLKTHALAPERGNECGGQVKANGLRAKAGKVRATPGH